MGNSLTNRPNGPPDWVDAAVPVESREPERAGPLRPSGDEDPAVAPAVPGAVCPDCPEEPTPALPATVRPPGRRVEPTVARARVPDAEPPDTDGAADCDVGAPGAAAAEADAPRDDWSRSVPTGVPTVGVRTGVLGSDGVLTDGVVRLGVLTCGVVTGPTVTGGTVTDGTLTVGTLTVGAVTVGTLTVGTLTVGTLTVGTLIDRTDRVGVDAAAAAAAAPASAPHTVRTASRKRLVCRVATRVEVAHRPTTGLLHSTGKPPKRDYTRAASPRAKAWTASSIVWKIRFSPSRLASPERRAILITGWRTSASATSIPAECMVSTSPVSISALVMSRRSLLPRSMMSALVGGTAMPTSVLTRSRTGVALA